MNSHRVAVKYLATTAKVSLGDEAHLQKEDVLRELLDGLPQFPMLNYNHGGGRW